MFVPIALGQLVASIETIVNRDLYRPDGYLRGMAANNAAPGTVQHRAGRVLDHELSPLLLGAATFGASSLMLAARGRRRRQIAAAAVIALANRLAEIRTPYGRDGADQMASLITQYRALTGLIPDAGVADDLLLRAINFQAGLSYAVSGISKGFGSSWVQGDALGEIVRTEAYGGGPAARLLRDRPRLTRFLSRATIVWESGFPLVYFLPRTWAVTSLHMVKLFHVGVAAVMELPRFVWGFVGSHGAIQYVIEDSSTSRGRWERETLTLAAGVLGASAIRAHERRSVARAQNHGLNGLRYLRTSHGVIECKIDSPSSSGDSERAGGRPTFLLESGLGLPVQSWTWVAENLSSDHVVISYHRPGYGETDPSIPLATVVRELLAAAGCEGPVVIVTHSIGSLAAARYLQDDPGLAAQVQAVVVIDGTDPDRFHLERKDRKQRGKFLQTQTHTMFAGVTGLHAWAPNAASRQAAYPPDDQSNYVQFVFSPQSVVRSTREFMGSDYQNCTYESFGKWPRTLVLASSEHAKEQQEMAVRLSAGFHEVKDSSHRTIVGYRHHAAEVAARIREFVGGS